MSATILNIGQTPAQKRMIARVRAQVDRQIEQIDKFSPTCADLEPMICDLER